MNKRMRREEVGMRHTNSLLFSFIIPCNGQSLIHIGNSYGRILCSLGKEGCKRVCAG